MYILHQEGSFFCCPFFTGLFGAQACPLMQKSLFVKRPVRTDQIQNECRHSNSKNANREHLIQLFAILAENMCQNGVHQKSENPACRIH
jgi:hypothetical protein